MAGIKPMQRLKNGNRSYAVLDSEGLAHIPLRLSAPGSACDAPQAPVGRALDAKASHTKTRHLRPIDACNQCLAIFFRCTSAFCALG